ncbi:MAG TPA: S8 family serine peptidase, partial [Thermoanaerobaculia bacterium]|nr:S8 family serine peptidase [Thermoanaerobaculia bacterium]
MAMTSLSWSGFRSSPRRLRAIRVFLVLCLIAAAGRLLGAPPGATDGHELPMRPGPRFPGDGPAGAGLGGPESAGPLTPLALAGGFPVHDGVARGHVVVRFRDEVPDWQREAVSLGSGGRAYRPARWADFARVEVDPERPPGEILAALRSNPAVLWAEADPVYSGFGPRALPAPSHQPINDPFFPLQWNLERIRYHQALDLNPTGGRGVVVAVIDSGVASGSGASFPTRRGLDLEGVTFLPGFDFVDGGAPHDLGVGLGDAPRAPRFGHGTFVASQIAAGVNNGLAGAGIAPQVTILPVRVLGPSNATTASVIAEAINFSVGAGADVINMSLGGPDPFDPVRVAIDNAVRSGVVVVAAAGNDAGDPDPPDDVNFPARYEGAIAVGSTGFDGNRASYSNPGPGLDLMAPAGESPGIRRGETRDAALATSFVHDPATGETLYGGFFATGTSFAA